MYWLALAYFYGASCLAAEVAEVLPASGIYDVRDYGAVGDQETLDTQAIQAAIDACAEAGGGTVVLASGTFLSGTIDLRDHVTLHLQAGAVLLASTRQHDFTRRCVIHANKVRNIAVVGRGTIDGNGHRSTEFPKVRAHLIYFIECRNVRVRDVTFRNSTTWVQHYLKCNDLVVDGITVDSRLNPEIEGPRHLPGAPGRNEDGMNLNSCHGVRVSNCHINSDDVTDLEIVGFDAQSLPSTVHGLIHLKQTRGAWIHGCRLKRPTRTFLRVDGDQSAEISLRGNRLSHAEKVVECGSNVPSSAVHVIAE